MSDLLEQATRALRETSAEPQPRSGLTRARVLESAEKRYAGRRTGLLRWVVALVAALAASTALARVAQYWPEIKRAIAPSSESADAAPAHKKKRAAAAPDLQPSAADAPVREGPAEQPDSPSPDGVVGSAGAPSSVAPAMPAPRRVKSHARRQKIVASEPPAPIVEPEPAPAAAPDPIPTSAPASVPMITLAPKPETESAELALFRRAQRLHLNHDPKALAAWDDYLRVARTGALVPEARYNRALSLIRQGRRAQARSALTPFAIGEYGNYRRAEAKSLIQALDETEK